MRVSLYSYLYSICAILPERVLHRAKVEHTCESTVIYTEQINLTFVCVELGLRYNTLTISADCSM